MRSFVTSYAGLFDQPTQAGARIERIEIPLIQRDYAQGRLDHQTERIRRGFLDVLHRAVTTGEALHLDFVYGTLRAGVFYPLDGQQRLTTLFLLHWYLAYRTGRLSDPGPWNGFGYAVRPSARLFCERLVECQPPQELQRLSPWLEDQPWHLYTWRHDPTIGAMLVMLDAIHERFRADDCEAAWERLVGADSPVVTFHLLPMEHSGSGEELYIKMNSRGKPLTPFENFKAHFEKLVEESHGQERAKQLALAIDTEWSDLLWPYRGEDQIIDDEFLRYFQFVAEVCEWRQGREPQGDVDTLAENVFGPSNPNAGRNLDFLFEAFGAWRDTDIAGFFGGVFTLDGADGRVALFTRSSEHDSVDLFERCCRTYDQMRGKNRVFTLQLTLLLYAALLHRLRGSADFGRRVRVLRNLIEGSDSEIRVDRMPGLLADVERLIVDGSLDGIETLNRARVADEQRKAELLARAPDLAHTIFALEDHPLLRGNLAAFELDAETLERRTGVFRRVFVSTHWPALTGALLAQGDYGRHLAGGQTSRFGSPTNRGAWADVLSGGDREESTNIRNALGALLDEMVDVEPEHIADRLDALRLEYLRDVEGRGLFDWRYYFVKYPTMRSGDSGVYVSEEAHLGYRVCMLRRRQLNSNYRDAFLYAVQCAQGVEGAVEDAWFTGYTDRERWMELTTSGTAVRCVDAGFVLRPPADAKHRAAFDRVTTELGLASDLLLRIPQSMAGGRPLDTRDRVQSGAELVRALAAAGL